LNTPERHYLQTEFTLKVRVTDKRYKLDKTQRNFGLLCAVLKVTSYTV